jgi:hypothetical protein
MLSASVGVYVALGLRLRLSDVFVAELARQVATGVVLPVAKAEALPRTGQRLPWCGQALRLDCGWS